MPPLFHSDIAAVEELRKLLIELTTTYEKLIAEAKSGMKALQTDTQNTTKVTAEHATVVKQEKDRYTELVEAQKKILKATVDNEKAVNKATAARKKQVVAIREANTIAQQEARTIDEMRKKVSALNLLWKNSGIGTKQQKELADQLKKTTAELKKQEQAVGIHGRNVGNYASAISSARMKIIGFTAAIAGTIAVIKKWVNLHSQMSDAMADVRKTTGLTQDEINGLNSELKKLNTRTAQLALLDLAYVAGKLGVKGTENVLGFVRAADQIGVALGRDLGNVEEATKSIGKLAELFNVTGKYSLEESMIRVGSAINSLGQSSTASEAYIVEFTKRLGGIANQAGISIQDVLGFGSALDQLGQQSETSGTALSQLIVKLFQDPAKFAKIAGLEVRAFGHLLQTDANAALLQFISALAKSDSGLIEMAAQFKDMGLDGRRSIGIITSLATNINIVEDAQRLSNDEFEKGTSIADEFAIKNENLAANIDKLGKSFTNFFQSSWVERFLTAASSGLSKSIDIISGAESEVDKLRSKLDFYRDMEGADWDKRRKDIQDEIDLIIRREKANQKYIGREKITAEDFTITRPDESKKKIIIIEDEITDDKKDELKKRQAAAKKQAEDEIKLANKRNKELYDLAQKELADEVKLKEDAFKLSKELGIASYQEVYSYELEKITESAAYRLLIEGKTAIEVARIWKEASNKAAKAAQGFTVSGLPAQAAESDGQGDFMGTMSANMQINPDDVLQPATWEETFNTIAGYAQTFGGIITDVLGMISESNQRQMEQEMQVVEDRYTSESALLDEQLRNKTISEVQYNARKAALEQKKQADEAKLKKEYAKKQRDIALTQAIINTALAVTSALTGGPVIGVILAVVAAAMGAIEIATISSQQFAKGGHMKLGEKGNVLQGKRHSQGGVNLGEVGTAEAGEYMGIINRSATRKYENDLPLIFDSLNKQNFENVFSHPTLTVNVDSKYSKMMFKEMTRAKPTESETTITEKMIITRTGNHTVRTYIG